MTYSLWRLCTVLCLALALCSGWAFAQGREDGRRGPGNHQQERTGGPRQPVPDVPTHQVDVILGRPTSSSIVLSVLSASEARVLVAYGPQGDMGRSKTETVALQPGQPRELALPGLRPNTRYAFSLVDAATQKPLAEGRFHTQRSPGSSFAFTLTADSHLDQNTDTTLYQRALANALADAPDFHIDLGDTFMTGKHESREGAARQYIAQRYYLGQLCRSAPLFLALGNHDGEEAKLLRDGADSLAVWSNQMRKRLFPNPAPDAFYSGNTLRDPLAGLLLDYYAWQWGDALFVVLNPYWHASGRKSENIWDSSLGEAQYQWLKRILEGSRARLKFVFIHQLVGGRDRQGRGGVEAAPFGEWGGKNADGSEGFKAHRPGWDAPIHQLLVRHRVSAVFHGHDHLYAKQELDGIVYQEVPQPGFPRSGAPRQAEEYGYSSGAILGGSGHLRVSVSPGKAVVDFIRASLPGEARPGQENGSSAHSYTINAFGK